MVLHRYSKVFWPAKVTKYSLVFNSLRLSGLPFLRGRLSDGDFSQETVVGVDDAVPGDGGGVDVQPDKGLPLLWGQGVGVAGLVGQAQLGQALHLDGGERPVAVAVGWHETAIERFRFLKVIEIIKGL